MKLDSWLSASADITLWRQNVESGLIETERALRQSAEEKNNKRKEKEGALQRTLLVSACYAAGTVNRVLACSATLEIVLKYLLTETFDSL